VRFLLDEMCSERVADLLDRRGHDALHVRAVGLGGAPDVDVLARAADTGRTLVTENAADHLPLLGQRQAAGSPMTPVLIALTAGRGVGGALHARLADALDGWANANPDPYAHAHWLS
jgi:predicted nuclease of predicted toxin-antitoxin system